MVPDGEDTWLQALGESVIGREWWGGAGIAHHEQSLISMIALFILYSLSIADAH